MKTKVIITILIFSVAAIGVVQFFSNRMSAELRVAQYLDEMKWNSNS